jgi:hypothetical protein
MFALAPPQLHEPSGGFWNVNLINLFGFYLAAMFVFSLYRRTEQYRAIAGLALAVPGRWPRLLKLIRTHGAIFLTWSTFLPAVLTLALTLANGLAARLVWPQAHLSLARLTELWTALPLVGILAGAMVAVDVYQLVIVRPLDRALLEGYFDQAEYWLRSWTAPVVHFFTLGRINPRQMVDVEVQKALVQASELMNSSLWWLTVQMGLRVAFGLSLWFTYAVGGHPHVA